MACTTDAWLAMGEYELRAQNTTDGRPAYFCKFGSSGRAAYLWLFYNILLEVGNHYFLGDIEGITIHHKALFMPRQRE